MPRYAALCYAMFCFEMMYHTTLHYTILYLTETRTNLSYCNMLKCTILGSRYGRPTSNWEELRADGSVPCTAAMFDSIPAPEGELNVCRCYSLHWCGENNVDKLVSDAASRRRNSFGVPGRNLHQRRRWCGWGARDCAWSSWSKWSECSGGKQCAEEGVSQRNRQQETEPENGGVCQPESTSEETKCHWVGCQKGQSQSSKMSKPFASKEAEGVLAKSGEAVKKAAEAAGVSLDLASKAKSKFLTTARAEVGSLTPKRLGRIAAEEFLPAVRTAIASSDVRANVVSLAGEVILLGVQDESPQMAHVVDVMASEIADALGLPSMKTSTSAPESGVQVFGSAGSTTTVPTIAIFPKDGSDSLQG